MGHEEPNPDRPQGVNTWLVIPYFDGDIGRKGVDRPLPPGKGASWLCPSIVVDGVPGNTAFRRGVPLRVALEVANWGAGTLPAAALVRLWWSDPTLAFSTAVAIGQTTIVVPPGGAPVRTGDFSVTIPQGASAHVCLLAQVSAPIDGASSVPDPYGDRHWAQLNLVEVTTVSADGTAVLPLVLTNPFAEPMQSGVAIEPMSKEEANHLGRLRGRDILTDVAGIEAELRDAEGEDAGRTELRGHETRQVEVTLRLSDPPAREAAHGIVLTQRLTAFGKETALTGTLGVLIAPD
jgi:hypothetical protein